MIGAGIGPWLVLATATALAVPAPLLLRARPRDPLDLRAIGPAALGVSILAVGSWLAFAFYADDHQYLVLSRVDPFAIEPQRRLLGIQLPFRLATPGGAASFALLNLAAAGAAATALGALLRTGGWTRTEAWLAGLLFVTTLPFVELLPWAAGLQQLAAWALVLGAAAAMNAATDATGRRRAALGALAVGLSIACVITKWPLAPLAPLVGWVFGALARRRAPHAVALASAVAVGAALSVVAPEPSAFHAGLDQVLGNLAAAGGRLGELAGRAAIGLALVLAARVGALRDRSSLGPLFLGASSRDTLRPALALGALSLAPFLFNDTYFAGYYLGPSMAWIAALGARALSGWLPSGPRGALAAAVFVALWFPTSVALDRWGDPRYHRLEVALADAAAALEEAPADLEEIAVVARCADPADTHASERALDALWVGGEGEWGLRWVSGRLRTRFVRDAERRPALVHCIEAPLPFRFETEPSSRSASSPLRPASPNGYHHRR